MQTETFELWEKDIPYYIGGETPKITYYPVYPRSAKSGKGTVIICPGGGYSGRAPHEGRGYAEYLNSQGLDAFVLDYRVKPNVYPAALCDARRAIRFVRYNAEKFGIDPEKVAIMGSSAGGHLAAHASTFIGDFDEEVGDEIDKMRYIPNGQILCYPVLDRAGHKGSYNNLLQEKVDELEATVTPMNLATDKTPPAYIWHTASDAGVNVLNSYRYASKLRELSIPTEMHIYPFGKHGLGLANQADTRYGTVEFDENRSCIVPHVQSWAPLMIAWLRLFGFYS